MQRRPGHGGAAGLERVDGAVRAVVVDERLARGAEVQRGDVAQHQGVVARVDEGPRIKRFQPKDRGRAHPIIKQMSHITIALEEKSGGKA